MADNEQGEETTTRGNEWEVVQLTASAYAAAPGPKKTEPKDEDKVDMYTQDDAETSHPLVMSRHFVFPPSQHENLPLQPDNSEIFDENVKSLATEHGAEEGDRSGGSGKDCDDGMSQGLDASKVFPRMPSFVDEGSNLPFSGSAFNGSAMSEGLHTVDSEKSFHDAAIYGSLHGESEIAETTFVQNLSIPDVNELTERDFNLPTDVSEPINDDKRDGSNLPSEAWWKRTAASLYVQAKEGNTIWSIFIAAAFTGLVILGQRWQQERLQVWRISLNAEKNGRMLGSLYWLKDVIVGGHRRNSLIRGSLSSDS